MSDSAEGHVKTTINTGVNRNPTSEDWNGFEETGGEPCRARLTGHLSAPRIA